MRSKLIFCAVWLGVVFSLPGFADVVSGAGAGSLPGTALDLSADPGLTGITGTLPDTGFDVAMFEIDIVNPLAFAAETLPVAFGIPDTELFLFNADGTGVYWNDDKSGADTLSCLPAFYAIATPGDCASGSSNLGPTSPGIYFLAITRSTNTPLDANNNPVFQPNVLSTDVLGPNSGSGPVASWDGSGIPSADTDLINYSISISEVPEPAVWPVTAALSLGLMLLRRKQRREE